jgi:hypothetical protein
VLALLMRSRQVFFVQNEDGFLVVFSIIFKGKLERNGNFEDREMLEEIFYVL